MGGKALKKIKAVRVGLQTIDKVKQQIYSKILSQIQIDFLLENPDKTDFGDLDVLYTLDPNSKIIIRDFIFQTFNPVELVTNGDVISFAYLLDKEEYLQVDFIKCPNLQMAKFYFSYGDLGNILGQITRFYEIRLGHLGLFINITKEICIDYSPLTDPDSLGLDLDEQVYLSEDPVKICEFFQWDYSKWGNFSTESEIFDWIYSSPYFSSKIFNHLNHNARHKVLTRPMFNRFVRLIEQIDWTSSNIEKKDRRLEAIKYFNWESKLNNLIELNQIKQKRKIKFNGKKILDLKILNEEKELGEFIKKFKLYIDLQYGNWDNWLDSVNSEQVNVQMILFSKIYSQN